MIGSSMLTMYQDAVPYSKAFLAAIHLGIAVKVFLALLAWQERVKKEQQKQEQQQSRQNNNKRKKR